MNMPERIDDRLQHFLSNLVSSKHPDLMEMLTEDAVMEFPYHLPTTPTQLVGKQEIVKYFAGIGNLMTFDEFRLVAAHQSINPDVAVLEYEGKGEAVQTGRSYQQKYIPCLPSVTDGSLIGTTTGIPSAFLMQSENRIRSLTKELEMPAENDAISTKPERA
jgi:ketosteroid isomerase-like protein